MITLSSTQLDALDSFASAGMKPAPALRCSFEIKCDSVPGVSEIFVRDNFETRFLDAGSGWAAPLLSRGGKLYLADSVYQNIQPALFVLPSLKFGPGGRRRYVEVTEALLESFFACSAHSSGSVKTVRRNAEIATFTLALVDLLSVVSA